MWRRVNKSCNQINHIDDSGMYSYVKRSGLKCYLKRSNHHSMRIKIEQPWQTDLKCFYKVENSWIFSLNYSRMRMYLKKYCNTFVGYDYGYDCVLIEFNQ